MIFTSGIVLLAFLGPIQPYSFSLPAPNLFSYGFNQALMPPQQPPLQPSPLPQLQPQFYSNQATNLQQLNNNNAQQIFQPQMPKFNIGPQQYQRNLFQQPNQQINHPHQRRVPLVNQNQLHQYQQQQQQLNVRTTIQNKNSATKIAPVGDKDFLSSLQIIDTQGRLRELKDFGLGGNGNAPEEPELERQLKNIFETINRDLEHADFLPLDVTHSAQQQLGSIFQGPLQAQRQQQQSKTSEAPAQTRPQQEQQQNLGYAFMQPKQHQFQFLKPLRAQQDQSMRSLSQNIRDAKTHISVNQVEQRPIEQLPVQQEILEQSPIKAPVEQAPVKQPQQEFKASTPIYREPEAKGRRQQSDTQLGFEQRQQEPSGSSYRESAEQQTVRPPSQTGRKSPTPIEQQQSQQGFDDEPSPLKSMEYEPTQQVRESPVSRQRTNDQQPIQQTRAREQVTTQQQTINEQVPLINQQNDDDERLTPVQPLRSQGAKKSEGWIPIVQTVQQAIVEQQKQVEPQPLLVEQQKEEQNYENQRPIIDQQKESQPVEQQKVNSGFELTKTDELPVQQEEQQTFVQQPQAPPKGPGKLNKLKKSISRFAATAKSKLSGSTSSGSYELNDGQQQQQQPIQQGKVRPQQQDVFLEPVVQQQREEIPLQQREETPKQQQEEIPVKTPELTPQQQTQQPQRLDGLKQLRVDNGARKLEQFQTTQREEPISTAAISTTTAQSIQLIEQVNEGRKVKLQLSDKMKAPVQKIRDHQQAKVTKQPQQQVVVETKRPKQQQQEQKQKQVSPARKPQREPKKEEPQQVIEEVKVQQAFDGPAAPVQQSSEVQEQLKQEDLQQPAQVVTSELQQQKQEISQQQELQPPQVGEDFTQQRQEELLSQQKIDQPSQQQEVLPTSAPLQQEVFSQQEVVAPQPQQETLSQQKEESVQAQAQVQENLPQEKEEVPQQKEKLPQKKEEQQREEFSQQRSETYSQQQKQEELVKQQDNFNQQQDNGPQQLDISAQQQKQDDIVQQQLSQQQIEQKKDETTPIVQQQQQEKQEQSIQEEEQKNQDDGQVHTQQQKQTDDQQVNLLNQEKQEVQVVESPQVSQIQEVKTKFEDEPQVVSTTQRPPTRLTRPSILTKEKNKSGKDGGLKQEVHQETDSEPVVATRTRLRISGQSTKLGTQATKQEQQGYDQSNVRPQTRARFSGRPRSQQQITSGESSYGSPGQQNVERFNNEGYLSTHQLLNTYNPLQFEPERISSLNRAPQSSSQNTNVNSPSGESY